MKPVVQIMCLVSILAAIGCKNERVTVQNGESQFLRDTVVVDGMIRELNIFVPSGIQDNPSLVFVLHGSGGTAEDAQRQTIYQFDQIAEDKKNTIVVYPQGYDNHWNDCRKNGSYKANQEDVNDTGFFISMIDHFIQNYQINPDHVFVTGISNGGHMCYKLAFEVPDRFRGFAPFVANIPDPSLNDCVIQGEPVSIMVINGTADRINPYEGGWVVIGQDSSRGIVLSTEHTLDYWKNLSVIEEGASIVEYDDINPNDDSRAIQYQWSNSKLKKYVALLEILKGGHAVPMTDTISIPEAYRAFLGAKNRDVNSPQLVMDFFEGLKAK